MRNLLEVVIKRNVWLKQFTLPFTDIGCADIVSRFDHDRQFGNQWTIHSVKSLDPLLSFALEGWEINDLSYFDELELLAVRLEYMTEMEQFVFKAAIETEQPVSIQQIINLSYNLDCYNDTNSEGQMAQSALKEDLELCSYTQCGGLFKEIYGYIPAGIQLSVINRFVALLKDEIFDGTKESSNKIMAVLEAECPRTIEDAIHVVRHLGDYQVLADRDAYGKKLMGQYGAVLTEHGIVMSRNWKCEKLNEEIVTNQVRWVLEIKSHGELTTVELDAVKSEWKAQCFEGWGREFEDVRITKELPV